MSRADELYRATCLDILENGFSDAVKGFILYDAKILRPKEMVVIKCKKASA